MKRHLLVALAAAGMLAGSFGAANAARVCAPSEAGKVLGPARVAAPSLSQYTTDVRGCVNAPLVDALGLVSKGFVFDPPAVAVNQILTYGTAQLPAGAVLTNIIINETSGAAVTGGLEIGTTSGGSDIITGTTGLCNSHCYSSIPDLSILKKTFGTTSPTPIFLQATTNFISRPAVNVILYYKQGAY